MNKKEVGEIRRRFKLERNNISHIYGCYVNSAKEIVSYIDESVAMLTQEETEKYLSLLRKSLSGTLGRNLMSLSFATKQVMDSDEVRLLSALRKSELSDAALRDEFYKCIIDAVTPDESGYVILLAFDIYDVPHYGKDGSPDDNDRDVFKYMVCCLCPVKTGKAQFGYSPDDKRFQNFPGGQLVAAPELGFMYPSFDERSANIYNALFYSRNVNEDHQDFIDAVFKTQVPMPAGAQQETFIDVMTGTLDKECSLSLMQGVHTELMERISVHKESRDPEPLSISPEDMAEILENHGVSAEQAEEIAQDFLKARGYDSLSLSERGGNGSVASFRFVPVQDGALRVDDYISVSVALDDGSIYSYDATRYSDDVPKLDWSCDEETARGSLPDNVSVIGSRKVIVQRPGGEYMACYEFDCTGSEGESLRIYADGSDGRQCRIQLEGV